jgi:hypothetical protein
MKIVEVVGKRVRANSKKPKLIKPNMGHASPHPYQGKLVGEENDPCWTDYKQIGMKQKGKKKVPNCVPK